MITKIATITIPAKFISKNLLKIFILSAGLIERIKIGRSYYYINLPLMNLFISVSDSNPTGSIAPIESVSEKQ